MTSTETDLRKRLGMDPGKAAEVFLRDRRLIVHADTGEMAELEAFLLEKGFEIGERESPRLPLQIYLREKKAEHLGNVTSAAAAASSGIIVSVREFYLFYALWLRTEEQAVFRGRTGRGEA